MSLLDIHALSKSFGSIQVLSDIALDVREGEIVSLLGPSGCGKSTLLRIIAGLERCDQGAIALDRRDVTHLAPGRRGIAMVFQNLALYPHMTARANMALPLRIRRLNKLQRLLSPLRLSPHIRQIEAEINGRVDDLAGKLAILDQLDRVPAQLSGGQRQRVAIGRAVIRESRLLLLDEPLSSLDVKLRVQAREEILEIQRKFGIACIFVTHDQSEALAISDRVAVMLKGRIAQFAPPAAIYRHPASLEVARFVGSPTINCLDGMVEAGGIVRAGSHTVALDLDRLPGTRLMLGLRPEHVQIRPASYGGDAAYRVARIEGHGHEDLIHLQGLNGNPPLISRAAPFARIGMGDHVSISFSDHDIHVFTESGARIDDAIPQVAHYARA